MKRIHPPALAILLLAVPPCALRGDPAPVGLLPIPAKIELRPGTFRLDANTRVVAPAYLKAEATTLAADLKLTGPVLPPDQAPATTGTIRLELNPELGGWPPRATA